MYGRGVLSSDRLKKSAIFLVATMHLSESLVLSSGKCFKTSGREGVTVSVSSSFSISLSFSFFGRVTEPLERLSKDLKPIEGSAFLTTGSSFSHWLIQAFSILVFMD